MISKGFPLSWPPYSSDFTLLDFWLWNEIKVDDVYRNGFPATLKQLEMKIEEAFEKISTDKLRSVIDSVLKRMVLCVNCDLEHIVFS